MYAQLKSIVAAIRAPSDESIIKWTSKVPGVSGFTTGLRDFVLRTKSKKCSDTFKKYRTQIMQVLDASNPDEHKFLNRRVLDYFRGQQPPYVINSDDPEQIHQLKTLLNVLYKIEKAILKIESTPDEMFLSSGVANITSALWEEVAQLPALVQSTPLHLSEVFAGDIKAIMGFLNAQMPMVNALKTKATGVDWFGGAGSFLGYVFEQADPKKEGFIYAPLLQNIQKIPTYFETLTQEIVALSPKAHQEGQVLRQNYQALDQETLEALEENCQVILHQLNTVFDGGRPLTSPLKWLTLYSIKNPILEIVELVKSQAGSMSDDSKKVVMARLHQLKFEVLAPLVGYSDKIEAYFVLKPGILTDTLIPHFAKLYDALAMLASKSMKLDTDLLSFNDSAFKQVRQDVSHHIKSQFQMKKVMNTARKEAFESFYQLIEDYEQEQRRLSFERNDEDIFRCLIDEFPVDIKEQLKKHYLLIHGYVKEIDPSLDLKMAKIFEPHQYREALEYVDIELENFKAIKEKLRVCVLQERASAKFIEKSHDDVIFNFETTLPEKFAPLAPQYLRLTTIDETQIVNLSTERLRQVKAQQQENCTQFVDLEFLERDELKELLSTFLAQKSHLDLSLKEAERLKELLLEVNSTPVQMNEIKKLCSSLQSLWTPIACATDCDEAAFLHTLNTQDKAQMQPLVDLLIEKINKGRDYLTTRKTVVKKAYQTAEREKLSLTPLLADTEAYQRRHYVMKHTALSRALSEPNTFVNQAMHQFLSTRSFTQLYSNELDLMSTPDQVRWLKSLRLITHNAHTAALKLESIKMPEQYWTSYGFVYDTYKLIETGSSVSTNIDYLKNDPFLKALFEQGQNDIQVLMQGLLSLKTNLGLNPENPPHPNLKNPSIWTAVLGANTLSSNLKALIKGQNVDEAASHEITNKSKALAVGIENLIDSKDSTLKLLMNLPSIYKILFNEIEPKLKELSLLIHLTYHQKVALLRTLGFTKILKILDHYEELLGLRPGVLTQTADASFEHLLQQMLKPAQLLAQDYIETVSGIEAFDLRKEEIQKRREIYQVNLRNINEETQRLLAFKTLVNSADNADKLEAQQEAIQDAYQAIKHIINRYRSRFEYDLQNDETPLHFRSALDRCLGTFESSKEANVYFYTNFAFACLKGEEETLKLKLADMADKLTYLDTQKIERLNTKPDVIKACAQEFIDTVTQQYQAEANTHFVHLGPLYLDELQTFIEEKKPQWSTAVLNDYQMNVNKDIERNIEQRIEADLRGYYADNDRVFSQLNDLHAVVLDLKAYINQTEAVHGRRGLTYESQQSLRPKHQCVNILDDILTSPRFATKEEKIAELKRVVNEDFLIQFSAYDMSADASWANKIYRAIFKILNILGFWIPACEKKADELGSILGDEYVEKQANRQAISFFSPQKTSLEEERNQLPPHLKP